MQRLFLHLLLTALVATLVGVTGRARNIDPPRVVMISVDGLMPSAYTDPALAEYTPNLRALKAQGTWADGVIGVLPSVTYPAHTTLITGVEPARHGIFDNAILDPEGKSNGGWYVYADAIKVPTLPMAVRARGLRAGAVTWPVTVGMDLDYLAPEHLGPRHPHTLSMLRVLCSPRDLLSQVEIARGAPFSWPQTDRDRTDIGTFILRTYAPHLFLLHLIQLDGAQHDFGPGSPEALQALKRVDAHVGEILAALRTAGLADTTTVAVVSDHGFLPVTRQVQINSAFKSAGLVAINERGLVTDWKAYFSGSGGSGYVFVKDPADEARVGALVRELASTPANGIRQVWDRAALRARGAHPDAAFGIDAMDGFATGNGHDALVTPSSNKGTHGFDPDRPALHASLILAGPAVQRRDSLGIVKMVQVAPTLARILGVGLAPDAGSPIPLTSGTH